MRSNFFCVFLRRKNIGPNCERDQHEYNAAEYKKRWREVFEPYVQEKPLKNLRKLFFVLSLGFCQPVNDRKVFQGGGVAGDAAFVG